MSVANDQDNLDDAVKTPLNSLDAAVEDDDGFAEGRRRATIVAIYQYQEEEYARRHIVTLPVTERCGALQLAQPRRCAQG